MGEEWYAVGDGGGPPPESGEVGKVEWVIVGLKWRVDEEGIVNDSEYFKLGTN